MPYVLGIDLGTTFVSAAVGDSAGTRMVPLAPEIVVPSLAYHAPGGALLTGAAALNAAADPASHSSSFGRGFKRRLGDPTPLMLGGAAYSPTALMAAQLRDVLSTVTGVMSGRPESIVLTCPAIWGPYRREQFAEVPRMAGVDTFVLTTEPEAAATHYYRERALGDGEVVAVYDLGGGTLDTTVLRVRAGAMEILGTPEGVEHLGGMDFDDALLGHLDERLDGAITALDPAETTTLARIRALCVQAKIDLSTEPDVRLTVPLPSGPRELTVTRLEFNAVIRPSVELTVSALRRTVASARLDDDDLSAVLLAGGSSRVPLVRQMVSEEFDRPVRATLHPKFTVALGAASVAAGALLGDRSGPTPPPATPARPRRWLVPAGAAALAVVAALVIALIGLNSTPTAGAGDTSTSARSAPAPDPLVLFDNTPVKPYRAFIGSDQNWSGNEVLGTASHPAIAADDTDGLHVTWRGSGPAQVYLQTVQDTRDLRSYVDNAGALVFTAVVHSSSRAKVVVGAHCVYPCGAELDASSVFRALPVGKPSTVRIPLHCFTDKKLNAKAVNTPFLVWSDGPLDVTFRDIAWEAGVADEPGASSCADLP
ncbi:Hsp70 family protein [Actinophytocola sp.]|uniref:Hsp70 family protein n=1 Tax=Actinophytocola sp. TaxID=1872138 RepID=UPI002D6D978D|nr:Hsp70 family protein [Actinophytocola sp.]HYQ66227.1 Hsp70 family protein [Actinophytocola sp.]